MYTNVKLKTAALRELSVIQGRGSNHTREFSIALAHVINSRIALPTVAIDDAAAYYRMHHAVETMEILSKFNELTPFDIRVVEDDVKALLQFRVNMAFLGNRPLAFNKGSGLVDFFTLSSCFSNEVLGLIAENSAVICNLINSLATIYDDFKSASVEQSQGSLFGENGLNDRTPN